MTNLALSGGRGSDGAPPWAVGLAMGGLYWLVFLLLLEPGNLAHAQAIGRGVDAGREVARIAGATVLGTLSAPPLLWLARRVPVRSSRPVRHAILQAAAAAALAAMLIIVSCPLAAWLIDGPRDLGAAIRGQLSGNWALVFYGELTFLAAAQLLAVRAPAATGPHTGYLDRLTATQGRRTTVVPLSGVDWIESQGNYVALQSDGSAHLVRMTLQALETRLDPDVFVRIHRRRLVAWKRVSEVTTLPGGDADLVMRDGSVLRMSRSYGRAVRARLRG